jgi:DNA-binding NarL/FixJ family response regulator
MPNEVRVVVGNRVPKQIVLIDPLTFVRECVAHCLRFSYDDAVVVSFATIAECLHPDHELRDVAFVLYNVHCHRAADPQVEQELEQLKQALGQAPIILLSDEDGADRIFEALERGARGYIPTTATLEVALGATRLVLAGGTFVPASSFASLASAELPTKRRGPLAGLFTQRQFAVLQCLRQGKANRSIAIELGLSEGTVKAHVRSIMQKLKATNRTQVVFLTREIFGNVSDEPAFVPPEQWRNPRADR